MPEGGRRAGNHLRAAVAVPQGGSLARAFVRRYTGLLERIGEQAPSRALEDALAAPDDLGGLAALLAEVAPVAPPPPDPLAAARARGVKARAVLLERAGGAYRAGEVAERLGITPQAVHARRQRGTLLAVPQPNGEYLYPVCQFGPRGALPGLGKVLRGFQVDEPWSQLAVLLAPEPGLGNRTPVEMMAAGDVEAAIEAVSGYGEHLG